MERSKKHKVHISTTETEFSETRENYTKVVMQKQMLLPYNNNNNSKKKQQDLKSEKEIEIQDHPIETITQEQSSSRGSPGLVKRRVLEMSQQTSLSRKASKNSPSASPKRSSNQRKTFNSPKRAQIEPSKLLYAPRPYSRQDASKTVQKLEFNTAVKSQGVLPATTKKGSSYKKPAVPPKPRNVVVKQRSSTKLRKSGEILSKKTNVLLQDEKSEQNDSGLSEEADDVFNESHISPIRNCSFASLSQKIDDQRFDLLKRRQSYSEFEDLIEKKRELRERMLSKIMFLREERDLLMEEKIENDQLGKKIAANLESVAKSAELDKFRQFLEEIEQITKLTVSLTIRLSRLSRKMESGSLSKDELAMIQKKKSRLVEQLNEADILHQNTDRRASQVRQMLSKYSKDQSEFDTFLVDLIKHITDLKETEQRIQLGEEQLVALNDNLISLP